MYHLVICTNLMTAWYRSSKRWPHIQYSRNTIFAKLGMQLHRRNQYPLGILKNAIYDYFDTNYPDKFDKFDDLCPIVSVRQVSSIMLRNHFLQCSCFCCCNYLLPVLELCSFLVPLSSFYFHIAGINSCFFPSSDRY